MDRYDVAVIGGGPAGMAAALGARAAYGDASHILLIERAPLLGGILNQCTHTGFGLAFFGEDLTGQEYARRFVERIDTSNIDVITDTTVLDISSGRLLTISGIHCGLRRVSAATVILATGCRERPIGTLPIAGSRPSGIFAAGAAQKMLNLGGYDIGDRFVILGSGDVGLIVARELAIRGKEVIAVVEKEATCGGMERNRLSCLEKHSIPLYTLTTISEVHGYPRIAGVTITDNHRYIECDALITSLGLVPERDLIDRLVLPDQGSGSRGQAMKIVAYGDQELYLPEWLFICGNAAYVHDIVDGVTIESERIGAKAAEYIIRSAE